jgi:hypothetical protein
MKHFITLGFVLGGTRDWHSRKIGQVRPVSFSFVALQRQFTDRSIKWLDQTRGILLKLDIGISADLWLCEATT